MRQRTVAIAQNFLHRLAMRRCHHVCIDLYGLWIVAVLNRVGKRQQRLLLILWRQGDRVLLAHERIGCVCGLQPRVCRRGSENHTHEALSVHFCSEIESSASRPLAGKGTGGAITCKRSPARIGIV